MTARSNPTFLGIIIILVTIAMSSAYADDSGKLIEKVFDQDLEGLKTLIAEGINVNAQDSSSGSTALMLACSYGFEDIAKLLLSSGADPNIQANNGVTALMAAAQTSQEIVELLLERKADIHLRAKDGTTAFTKSIIGVISGRVKNSVPELLLEKGADVNEAISTGRAEGYTPLMMAASNDALDLAKFLIGKGANVNAKAKDGSTALSLAIKEDHEKMVKLLQARGAKE
jgi:ankyrin repeat protein